MNPSTALARVVVDQLIRSGVSDFVLAPGSRSAPLALELAAAERHGEVSLHVRIDERSAAYLGLGIARVSGQPVAVVCTSGTAVVNCGPAVVEASYAGVPLVVVSADRPPELRNTGSNQTIDQVGIFGAMVRRSLDVVSASATPYELASWRSQIARAVWSATGADSELAGQHLGPGPVQINVGLREPLVPARSPADSVAAPDVEADWPTPRQPTPVVREPINYALGDIGLSQVPTRGVVLVGDVLDPADSLAAVHLAQACGWPIISEPSGNALTGATAVPAASLVLANPAWLATHRPELIVTVGRFGLSRSIMALVRAAKVHLAVGLSGRDRPDPLHTAAAMLSSVPRPPALDHVITWNGPDPTWVPGWRAAGQAAAAATEVILNESPDLCGIHVARTLWSSLRSPDLLLVAASRSVRDIERCALPASDLPRVIGNRGVSGIDGLVSTAFGAALVRTRNDPQARTVALLGDLAFLHDHNGLLFPASETAPNLTIVVSNNNGGGIFSDLEQGQPQFTQDFERVFGTPHDRDLVQIARAAGVRTTETTTEAELRAQLSEPNRGLCVIIVQTAGRISEQNLQDRLKLAAQEAAQSAR